MCHGNVCRSPFAEVVFAQRMQGLQAAPVAVSSAGFIGPNRQPPPQALATAGLRGADLSNHRSTVITGSIAVEADLIVVMAADQAAAMNRRFPRIHAPVLVLGDFDPLPIITRTIRDPWGCDDAVFAASYDRISRCVTELAAAVATANRLSSERTTEPSDKS